MPRFELSEWIRGADNTFRYPAVTVTYPISGSGLPCSPLERNRFVNAWTLTSDPQLIFNPSPYLGRICLVSLWEKWFRLKRFMVLEDRSKGTWKHCSGAWEWPDSLRHPFPPFSYWSLVGEERERGETWMSLALAGSVLIICGTRRLGSRKSYRTIGASKCILYMLKPLCWTKGTHDNRSIGVKASKVKASNIVCSDSRMEEKIGKPKPNKDIEPLTVHWNSALKSCDQAWMLSSSEIESMSMNIYMM